MQMHVMHAHVQLSYFTVDFRVGVASQGQVVRNYIVSSIRFVLTYQPNSLPKGNKDWE